VVVDAAMLDMFVRLEGVLANIFGEKWDSEQLVDENERGSAEPSESSGLNL
jgi:hypothetical protein